MSHFAFGVIQISDEKNREDVEWSVVAAGLSAHVHVNLDWNIVQEVVHEMLRTRARPREPNQIAFLLTGRPSADTSEPLIYPDSGGDAFDRDLALGLDKLRHWSEAVLRVQGVDKLVLWMTEGFDDAFQDIAVVGHKLADELWQLIVKDYYVPSLRIQVTKD